MVQDGLDPAVFNNRGGAGEGTNAKAESSKKSKKKKKKDNIKRKKFFWEPLRSLPEQEGSNDNGRNTTREDCIWGDIPGAGSFPSLDLSALNKLFTLSEEDSAAQKNVEKVETAPQVAFLDSRRAQNACIALSRIRLRYSEIRNRVATLDDGSFTTTQLEALMEYSPTPDERMMTKSFTGDITSLGPAELFMLEMSRLPSPGSLLKVMLFKRQFSDRVDTLKEHTSHIHNACSAVTHSNKLRRVFHAIRAIGNAMNQTQSPGFALPSLGALSTTKGFDKKTTVMRFLIQHLSSSELGRDALTFPGDLHSLTDALQVSPKGIETDLRGLCDELKGIGMVVAREVQITEKDRERTPLSPTIFLFLQSAASVLDEVQDQLRSTQERFRALLSFLGIVDTETSPTDCFGPLHEFSQSFLEEKHRHDADKLKLRSERKIRAI